MAAYTAVAGKLDFRNISSNKQKLPVLITLVKQKAGLSHNEAMTRRASVSSQRIVTCAKTLGLAFNRFLTLLTVIT